LHRLLAPAGFDLGDALLVGDRALVRGVDEVAGADPWMALSGERPDHAERGKIDAGRLQARLAHRLHQAGEHVAAGGDRDHVDALAAVLRGRPAHDLPVHDRLLKRHRDVVLRLEADRRLQLLRVVDLRQSQGSHRDPLIGDAEAYVLRELVLGKQLLQGLAQGAGIGHLALTEHAGPQRDDAEAGHLGATVALDLAGGNAPGLDIETDHCLALLR
jgi:hypothetical protein